MILSDLPRICLLRSCSRDDMVLPVSITVLHQVFLLYLLIDSVAYLWGTTGEWLWYSVWTSDRQMWRTFRNVLLEIKWRHHSSSDINLQPCLGQLQSILGLKLPRVSLRSRNQKLLQVILFIIHCQPFFLSPDETTLFYWSFWPCYPDNLLTYCRK